MAAVVEERDGERVDLERPSSIDLDNVDIVQHRRPRRCLLRRVHLDRSVVHLPHLAHQSGDAPLGVVAVRMRHKVVDVHPPPTRHTDDVCVFRLFVLPKLPPPVLLLHHHPTPLHELHKLNRRPLVALQDDQVDAAVTTARRPNHTLGTRREPPRTLHVTPVSPPTHTHTHCHSYPHIYLLLTHGECLCGGT